MYGALPCLHDPTVYANRSICVSLMQCERGDAGQMLAMPPSMQELGRWGGVSGDDADV